MAKGHRTGETSCAKANPNRCSGAPTATMQAGETRERRGLGHGQPEDDKADHQSDGRSRVEGHDGWVDGDGVINPPPATRAAPLQRSSVANDGPLPRLIPTAPSSTSLHPPFAGQTRLEIERIPVDYAPLIGSVTARAATGLTLAGLHASAAIAVWTDVVRQALVGIARRG
jgi:hypothetical protein